MALLMPWVIICILLELHICDKEKNNASGQIQIKLKTIKQKQMVLKSNLTLNYNSQNKKK